MKELRIYDVRENPGDSAFLIDDGKTAVMYDSGFAFTGYAVAEKIKSILGERPLNFIFLTHSHYDHALGSVYALEYYPTAQVVAGEYAAKIFAKPTARAVMRDLDRKFAKKCGISEYVDLIDGLRVDVAVSDGDVINAGDMRFTVMELAGHTRCSVGFYCKEQNLLLGSETLGVFNGTDDVVPSYLVGYETALNSIEKVKKLNPERILIPHYGVVEGETARFYLEKAEENAKDTANMIVDMLKRGKSKKEIVSAFKERFYHGYIKTVYPIDAMELNTGITVDLIEKELM